LKEGRDFFLAKLKLLNIFCVYIIFFLLMKQILFASEPEDLGEIIVIESEKEQSESPAESHPSFVTVIKNEELDKRFNDIPEVLEKSVGVRIKKSGGLGDFSTISIRGSSSEQVLIYLDGILLNESQGGGVNLEYPLQYRFNRGLQKFSQPLAHQELRIVNIKTKFPENEISLPSFSMVLLKHTGQYSTDKPEN
jgi:outer membrane receptor for ferrienterochelin and colicin